MFYRYEARRKGDEQSGWMGIFQCLNPYEKRKWYCLCEPKWYKGHPDVESQAWFTQHGYEKWHEKMEETIESFLSWNGAVWETRLITADTLSNIVFKGRTQCIIEIGGSYNE